MDRAEIQSCSPSLSPRVSHPERSRTRFPGLNEGSLKHKQALSEKHLAVHTFACPDLTTFLGLIVVGQHLTAKRAVIECRIPIGFEDPFCKVCGAQEQARGTVARRLAHVPVGWRPTQLVVRLRRFACTHCRRVWRQDTSTLAEPRARLTHAAVEWGLRALSLESMSVSRVAQALGISWHTANNAVLTRAEQVITGDPDRFDGVEVLGVDDSPARFALVREVPPVCGATPGGVTGTSPS